MLKINIKLDEVKKKELTSFRFNKGVKDKLNILAKISNTDNTKLLENIINEVYQQNVKGELDGK